MIGSKKLTDWIRANKLNCVPNGLLEEIFSIPDVGTFLLLDDSGSEAVVTDDLQLQLSPRDQELTAGFEITHYVFNFGGMFYYNPVGQPLKLNLFKYLGKARRYSRGNYVNLGVHSGYEMLNGLGTFESWCRKAVLFDQPALGLAEKNTLAGTLAFQMACQQHGLKSVLGETITISATNDGQQLWTGKIYATNERGWRNMLLVNAEINVHNTGWVGVDKLRSLGAGLIFVFETEAVLSPSLIADFKTSFQRVYFQFSAVQFTSNDKEKKHLEALKNYLDHFQDLLPPVLLSDLYYVDAEYAPLKRTMNKLGNVKFQYHSDDQYLKNVEDVFLKLRPLFPDSDTFLLLWEQMRSNTLALTDECDFTIELGRFKLPAYEMTAEQARKFADNEALFWAIVEEGFARKVENKELDCAAYEARVQAEVTVIKKGGFVDYFLMLWDIIQWCEVNDVLVGIGRGSAAGSLVAYLMDITQIDPIPYDLLFERFLNENRISKIKKVPGVKLKCGNVNVSLDIDVDVDIQRDGKALTTKAKKLQRGDIITDWKGRDKAAYPLGTDHALSSAGR